LLPLLSSIWSNNQHYFSSSTKQSIDNAHKKKEVEQSNSSSRKLVANDGLTLSHFIAGSTTDTSKLQSPGVQSPASSLSSNIPQAVELGTEFDDVELESMITDALSSSTIGNDSSSSTNNNPLDRLGHQMVNNEVEEDGNNSLHTLKFHLKTYGCQMNVNDTDIVRSILLSNHLNQNGVSTSDDVSTKSTNETQPAVPLCFIETTDEIQADVLLTNTCAIRENAEQKVWNRLRELRSHDRNYPLSSSDTTTTSNNRLVEDLSTIPKELRKQRQLQKKHNKNQKKDTNTTNKKKKRIIGVLGCMAERLKEDMFKDGTADVVVGPDAYRDLPRLISVLSAPSVNPNSTLAEDGSKHNTIPTERAVNVQLSLDETYASITPIRSNPNDVSAFVSIMRGCNNMCSYCVVPFTRGRERSREMESVVEETKRLVEEEDIKEVILLGQNVNSYHDKQGENKKKRGKAKIVEDHNTYQTSNDGFTNMFRLRHGYGYRFADLLEAVSDISPELRVRFTSPHPKDYPPPLLSLMAERPNICNHLHMPAQSGSSSVLDRMRRGYTREAYLELIHDVRDLIPDDVAISSDFIAGFCGETEDEHKDTLSLMEKVQYEQAFMFAYSMRAKTHAHRKFEDDISAEVKNRRLNEIIDCFRHNVQLRNTEVETGKLRLVLVEGESKKSTAENRQLSGRTDQNKRVVFASDDCLMEEEINPYLSHLLSRDNCVSMEPLLEDLFSNETKRPTKVGLERGDYAVVQINEVRGHTLKGKALWRSSIQGFLRLTNMQKWTHDSSTSLLIENLLGLK